MASGDRADALTPLKEAVVALAAEWQLLVCSSSPRLVASATLLLDPVPFRPVTREQWLSGDLVGGQRTLLLCDDRGGDGGAVPLLELPGDGSVLVGLDDGVSQSRLVRLWRGGSNGLLCRQRTGEGQLLQALACLLRGNTWLDPGFAERLRQSTCCSERLSSRDEELIGLLARGRSTREMASLLQVRSDTVRRRLSGLYARTGCRDQRSLLAWGLEQGIVRPHDWMAGSRSSGHRYPRAPR